MSVFDRLETLLRSEWHARRPGQRFGDELVDDLQQARAAMQRLSSDEQLLERRIQQSRSEVRYRQAQAERAVQQGNEQRARNELRQRIQEEQRLESMERDWHDMRRRIDSIQDTLKLAERQAVVAPYDREQSYDPRQMAPPAMNEGSSGPSYYRALGAAPERNRRQQPVPVSAKKEPSAYTSNTYGQRDGQPGFSQPASRSSSSVSSDPFERFEDMEANINQGLYRSEADAELAGGINTDDFAWDNDPLADPLESKFDELESEQNLKRLKESHGQASEDGGDGSSTRLIDKFKKDWSED